MPKVSVIVPVYGVEKYIERCARSLFEQTLDDIEYIFVDDCSPDRSIEILEKVIEEYPYRKPQVKIIRLEKNGGQAKVRKTGTQLATGDYIIHCDSDDWVDVTMYEKMYCKAIETDADMVWCDFYISDGITSVCTSPADFSKEKESLMKYLLCGSAHSSLCSKMVKKVLYEKEIVYPQNNMREDLTLVVQLTFYSSKIEKIALPLYYYYSNADSISKNLDYEKVVKRFDDSFLNFTIINDFLSKKGLANKYKKELNCLKFSIKGNLETITNTKEGKAKWKESFPELSFWDLISLNASYKHKLRYIFAEFGIYSFFKKKEK